jgi:hypothetical protein
MSTVVLLPRDVHVVWDRAPGTERPVLFVVGMGQCEREREREAVDVAACRLVNGDRRFEETYCLPLSGSCSPGSVFLVPLTLKTVTVLPFETSATLSLFRLLVPKNGGSTFLRNVGNELPIDTGVGFQQNFMFVRNRATPRSRQIEPRAVCLMSVLLGAMADMTQTAVSSQLD